MDQEHRGNAAQRRAMAAIGCAIGAPGSVAVLTGEAGSGKSMLAAHLFGTIDPRCMTVARIGASASLECEVEAAVVSASRNVGERGRAPRRLLLAVDDAHLLTSARLCALDKLTSPVHRRTALSMVLLGRGTLEGAIRTAPELAGLCRRVVAWHRLAPCWTDARHRPEACQQSPRWWQGENALLSRAA